MTQQDYRHPIAPPPELVKQIALQALEAIPEDELGAVEIDEAREEYIANFFAQWGADQELDACCAWLSEQPLCASHTHKILRAARRPKPPSLKEQALEDLESLIADLANHGMGFKATNIRRALEQLDD